MGVRVEYRLYFLNQSDHITEFLAFEESDDDAAVVVALERARGRPVELWQRERLVMRHGPDGADDPSQAVAQAKADRKAS